MTIPFFISSLFCLVAGNALSSYGMVIVGNYTGLPEIAVSIVFLANFVPILFIYKLIEKAISSYGARNVLIAGLWFYAFPPTILAVLFQQNVLTTEPFMVLIGLALINGVALATSQSARMAMIIDISPSSQASSQKLLSLIIIVSFSVAPIAFEFLKIFSSFTVTFSILSLTFLGFSLLLFYYPSSIQKPVKGDCSRKSLPMLVNWLLVSTCLAMTIMGLCQVVIPLYLTNDLMIVDGPRALYLSLFGLGLMSGGILAKFTQGEFSPIKCACTVLSINTLIMVSLSIWQDILLPALFVMGICSAFAFTFISAFLQELTPEHQKALMSTRYTLVFNLSPAFSGVLAAILYQISDLSITLLTFSLFSGLSALLLYTLDRRHSKYSDSGVIYGLHKSTL